MKEKRKKYEALRKLMAYQGVTYADICDAWNQKHTDTYKYTTWFSALMCGKADWKLEMCYFVLDYLGVPHSMFSHYFPKGGDNDDAA